MLAYPIKSLSFSLEELKLIDKLSLYVKNEHTESNFLLISDLFNYASSFTQVYESQFTDFIYKVQSCGYLPWNIFPDTNGPCYLGSLESCAHRLNLVIRCPYVQRFSFLLYERLKPRIPGLLVWGLTGNLKPPLQLSGFTPLCQSSSLLEFKYEHQEYPDVYNTLKKFECGYAISNKLLDSEIHYLSLKKYFNKKFKKHQVCLLDPATKLSVHDIVNTIESFYNTLHE